jgi:hypothetical protein
MADRELAERLMAAYQFVAPNLGDRVSLADVRLHLGTVEPHLLNPLLRELDGTQVEFWVVQGGQYRSGVLHLLEPEQDTPWRELDEGVDVEGAIYSHLRVQPF